MNSDQAAAILIFTLTLAVIFSERLHRTTIAMVGAAIMLVVGMMMGFYSQSAALAAIDFNTLGLLLGMMILVRLLGQTGFFQYIAIQLSKRSRGKPWLLLLGLGAAATVLSMFLDNVTTVVLIVPVTILIAEILGITPAPLLMAEVVLANTGGVATLVGDPPNVLIGSAAGFSFTAFLTHLAPIVALAWLAAIIVLFVVFRHEISERPRNIKALGQLDERQALSDPAGLRRLLVVLTAVILLFFLHGTLRLEPAAVALTGAAAALLWVRPDVDETLRHVEWGVLLFFAALFVLTGGLAATGVLAGLAAGIADLANANLLAASLILLWVAAIISAVVDNIPFTIAVIPILLQLEALGVQATPLWWALALGAGFGGNGTPIGATANVITVSLSARTHTPITMALWLRSGLPVMLVTSLVASLAFVAFFGWMSRR